MPVREAIAQHYQTIQAHEVLTFCGAEEPIFAFMQVAIEPGEHLICSFPTYQSHYSLAEARGIEVSRWYGQPEHNWAPSLADLKALIRPNTKALILCSPANPTGHNFTQDAWEEILKIARAFGIVIFADEVYRGTEHNEQTRLPHMADCYELGISLNCLSKNCGLAGLRMGWIATHHQPLYQKLAAYKDYLSICNSTPSEYLSNIALRHLPTLYARTREQLHINLSLLEAFFACHSDIFRWQRPNAGTTTFPEYLGKDPLAACERLIHATGIMLVPSTFFDVERAHFRVGYGRKDFHEALNILEKSIHLLQ